MRLIGIRGATMLQKNDAVEMKTAVIELLKETLEKNNVKNEDLVSIIFTTTEDLNCAYDWPKFFSIEPATYFSTICGSFDSRFAALAFSFNNR